MGAWSEEAKASAAAKRAATKTAAPSTPKFSAEPKKTRAPRGRRKPTEKQIALEVGSILQAIQMGVTSIRPDWKEDELSNEEVGLLSKAVAAEILYTPALLQWYGKLEGVSSPHTRLGAAVFVVSMPRLVKHGILPMEIAGPIVGLSLVLLGLADAGGTIADSPASPPSGAGTALRDHGQDGEWQVSTGSTPDGSQRVPLVLQDEEGHREVANGYSSEIAEVGPVRDGRH